MRETIDRLVRTRAAHDGAKPMVIDPNSRLTYRELDTTTRDLAAAFVEADVGKGTRVGLIMPNGVRWVQVAIALARIGAVLVPLSTLLKPGELVAQLRAASVQFLVSVEEFRGHRYLDEMRTPRPTGLPTLRHIWTADRLAHAPAGAEGRGVGLLGRRRGNAGLMAVKGLQVGRGFLPISHAFAEKSVEPVLLVQKLVQLLPVAAVISGQGGAQGGELAFDAGNLLFQRGD